jgi:hypothetical protein
MYKTECYRTQLIEFAARYTQPYYLFVIKFQNFPKEQIKKNYATKSSSMASSAFLVGGARRFLPPKAVGPRARSGEVSAGPLLLRFRVLSLPLLQLLLRLLKSPPRMHAGKSSSDSDELLLLPSLLPLPPSPLFCLPRLEGGGRVWPDSSSSSEEPSFDLPLSLLFLLLPLPALAPFFTFSFFFFLPPILLSLLFLPSLPLDLSLPVGGFASSPDISP